MADPTLESWRDALLATVPRYSALLFAPPAERGRAATAVKLPEEPKYEPLPLPSPRWMARPEAFPADKRAYLSQAVAGWQVSLDSRRWPPDGLRVLFNVYTGRHVAKTPGRKTHHGRLDVAECARRWQAWEQEEGHRKTEHQNRLREIRREHLDAAVRLGTGWMIAHFRGAPFTHYDVETGVYATPPGFLIFDPERDLWWAPQSDASFTPAEAEKLDIIERGPPAREAAPSLTFDEIAAECAALGYTTETAVSGGHLKTPVMRAHWRGVRVGTFFATHEDRVCVIGFGSRAMCATLDNLRVYLAAERDSEIKTRGQRAAELMAEIETLRT